LVENWLKLVDLLIWIKVCLLKNVKWFLNNCFKKRIKNNLFFLHVLCNFILHLPSTRFIKGKTVVIFCWILQKMSHNKLWNFIRGCLNRSFNSYRWPAKLRKSNFDSNHIVRVLHVIGSANQVKHLFSTIQPAIVRVPSCKKVHPPIQYLRALRIWIKFQLFLFFSQLLCRIALQKLNQLLEGRVILDRYC
jgi:hypothetical protein